MNTLEREEHVYRANLEAWRKGHLWQFVVIKDDAHIGFFKTIEEAVNEATKRFGLAPYLLSQITPSDAVNVSFLGKRLLAS